MIVVATGVQLSFAVSKTRKACEMIKFDGAQFRRDIAYKGIARSVDPETNFDNVRLSFDLAFPNLQGTQLQNYPVFLFLDHSLLVASSHINTQVLTSLLETHSSPR